MSSSLLIRQKLSQVLNILLRIPPLFILDAILLNNIQFSKYIDTSYLPVSYNDSLHKKNFLHNSTFSSDQLLDNKLNVSVENDINLLFFKTFLDNASILVMILVFLMALIIFLLPLKHLCNFYRNILIFWTALLSYRINNLYYDSIHHIDPNQDLFEEAGNIVVFLTQSNHIRAFVSHYICQMILATTFIHLAGIYRPFASFLAFLYLILPYQAFSSYTSPYRLYLIYLPSIVLVFSLIYPISSVIYNSQKTFYSLCDEINWIKAYMRDLGLFALIENQWNRLNIPYVFRIFWISRVVLQASVLLMEKNQENLNAKSMAHFFISVIFDTTFLLECLKHLLVRGCETMVAVLGMTSVLSGITYRIGCLIQSFLMIDDYEDRSIGSISAILFFIIALQNDLTSMDPEKRLQRLYRSFYLLFAAMLHFFHNMVSPSLFSLSASRNLSFTRHFRALIVCAGLIISPYFFLIYLWNNHTLSTWLLAVSTFCIEVIVKVIITLLIYTLFMIDAFRSSIWEQLDDYVYYVRTVGNLIEFIFGIFLFLNGSWILIFESGGTIRALLMCIHAYFNIWCQAIAGLKTFFKRYQALQKINSLKEASPEQLEQFDDVCSICYQELSTARITKCNHYFHSVCLRKWLYLQDICPLCHRALCS